MVAKLCIREKQMKKVPCAYERCGERRIHWCQPDTPRGTQYITVEDDFDENKKAYCSTECALQDGAFKLRNE